jgi:hypothetical protein
LIIASLLVVGVFASSASAATATWSIHAVAEPSVFSAKDAVECEAEGKCDRYQLLVQNLGVEASHGVVKLTDVLPPGILARGTQSGEGVKGNLWGCSGVGSTTVVCELNEAIAGGHYAPFVYITVSSPANETAKVLKNEANVESEEAATAHSVQETPANVPPLPFSVNEFTFEAGGETGAPVPRAGAHPWELTTSFGVPAVASPPGATGSLFEPVKNIKRVIVELPLGFFADPPAATKPDNECTEIELHRGKCPPESRVGTFAFTSGFFSQGEAAFTEDANECCSAVYDMKPDTGYPAQFGFTFAKIPVNMYASTVRTQAGYRLRIVVPGLSEEGQLLKSEFTLYGEPGKLNGGGSEAAFLSNPTDCSAGALTSRIELTSWAEPEDPVSAETSAYLALTGCDLLQFVPSPNISLSFAPSPAGEGETGSSQADEPSAYTADIKLPQSSGFLADATPPLKNVEMTLPAGVSINLAAGQGLAGCHAEGPEGINIGSNETGAAGQDLGDPEATELGAGYEGGDGSPYDDGVYHIVKGHCQAASTIGGVEIATPMLTEPLKGHIYLAQPKCGGEGRPTCKESSNPSEDSAENGELFGLYLEAEGSGVIFKIPGMLSANPQTGQLTASFTEIPQLPFSELKLHLHGGPRAPLANPQSCGSFTTTSVLEPWSHSEAGGGEGTPDATPSSGFVVGGCAGGAGGIPFNPSFTAGTTPSTAGGSGQLTLTLSRNNGEQNLAGLGITLPPGLLGKIAGVEECLEAQANAGSCSSTSTVGTATLAAGSGSLPLWQSGVVYLTGPYHGAPFGLSIVVPANAGPFHLGNIVVRAAISVNPTTGALIVTSDPLPQSIGGVALRLRTVNLTIDREGFIFNPTNCSQSSVNASVSSPEGAQAAESSPFQASKCGSLKFKPSFSAATEAKTSHANGASLSVKLLGGRIGEANLESVEVDIPRQLPSRLTTLQQACTSAQFESNPASCPPASVIGHATVDTSVLNAPLTGPVYFVSHGGETFPSLILVLQGEGVTIDLEGTTFINQKGITSVTFKQVPDAPVGTFELTLPEGPYSALGTNKDLCSLTRTVTTKKTVREKIHDKTRKVIRKITKTVAETMVMPTMLTGQNGAQVHERTRVSVTGCAKVRKHAKRGKRGKTR